MLGGNVTSWQCSDKDCRIKVWALHMQSSELSLAGSGWSCSHKDGWVALSSLPTHLSLSQPKFEAFPALQLPPGPCWKTSLRGLGCSHFSCKWHRCGSAALLAPQTSGESLLNDFVCVTASACVTDIINRTAWALSVGHSPAKYQTSRVKSAPANFDTGKIDPVREGKEGLRHSRIKGLREANVSYSAMEG